MNKKQLIKEIARRHPRTQTIHKVDRVVNTMLNVILEALEDGDTVRLQGLCTFTKGQIKEHRLYRSIGRPQQTNNETKETK
jgi:nucleoid DNA-binding protein